MELIINGVYRHYKGNNYKVLHVARHSETLEDLIVYQALYKEQGIWVRPLNMFLEHIEKDGDLIERFAYVGTENQTQIQLDLPKDVREYVYENDIDIARIIKTEFQQVTVTSKSTSEGTKDLGLVIICTGVAASLVVIAINRLVETVIKRPKYVEVTELSEDGNVLTTRTELLQPNQSKRELNIGFEINAQNVKLNITDKSE